MWKHFVILALLPLMTPTPAHAQRTAPSEWKWIDKNIAEGCQHATLFSEAMQREIGYSMAVQVRSALDRLAAAEN